MKLRRLLPLVAATAALLCQADDACDSGLIAANSHLVVETLPNYFTATAEARRREYATAISVFQHVHKSGGIMVRRFLEAMEPHLEVDTTGVRTRARGPYGRRIIAGLTGPSRQRLIRQKGRIPRQPRQIVHGDHAFHYCDYLATIEDRGAAGSVRCGYWIVLRDPVDRMVSDYNYCMKMRQPWAKQLELWRAGRGDRLCSSTGLHHFNHTLERPSLGLWVGRCPPAVF